MRSRAAIVSTLTEIARFYFRNMLQFVSPDWTAFEGGHIAEEVQP